jgi:hypothetical protein
MNVALVTLRSALDRQPQARDDVTVLTGSLPTELRNLIAQLVAFEARSRGANAQLADVLQSVMAQLIPDVCSSGRSMGRSMSRGRPS